MVVVASYLVFAPFHEAPLQSFYCVLFVSAGIPFYLGFVRYKVAPPSFLLLVSKSTVILHTNCITITSSKFIFPRVSQVVGTRARGKITSREKKRVRVVYIQTDNREKTLQDGHNNLTLNVTALLKLLSEKMRMR